MQAFFCDCVRARTKLGMAIAARRPMMATTIMISTRVKPALREVLFFILAIYLSFLCGVGFATGGLTLLRTLPTDCPLRPQRKESNQDAKLPAFRFCEKAFTRCF